jgi:glycosyltransferase involved in cell wall biosynthesis
MANKVPVITTPVGSIPFLLKENKHALFTQPGNVKALTNTIEELLNNERLQYELKMNGFVLAQKHTLESSVTDIIHKIKSEIPNG